MKNDNNIRNETYQMSKFVELNQRREREAIKKNFKRKSQKTLVNFFLKHQTSFSLRNFNGIASTI